MGNPPKIFITGLAGSGTTWMARFVQELGYDLGDDLYNREERKGLEWRPLLKLKQEIDRAVMEHGEFTFPGVYLDRQTVLDLRAEFQVAIRQLECPEVVKIPGLNLAAQILFPELKPGLVIMMHRPLREWAQTQALEQQKRGVAHPKTVEHIYSMGALHTGQLLDALEALDGVRNEYIVIAYPKAACSADYAATMMYYRRPTTLAPLDEFRAAHKRATDLASINRLLPGYTIVQEQKGLCLEPMAGAVRKEITDA